MAVCGARAAWTATLGPGGVRLIEQADVADAHLLQQVRPVAEVRARVDQPAVRLLGIATGPTNGEGSWLMVDTRPG
jgi:hypothetical protein